MVKMTTIEKNKCRQRTKAAIVQGLIIPTPCEKCGNAESQVHHEDYEDHLNVHFLCRGCHVQYHAAVRSFGSRIIDGFYRKWLNGDSLETISAESSAGPFRYYLDLSKRHNVILEKLCKKMDGSINYILQRSLESLEEQEAQRDRRVKQS